MWTTCNYRLAAAPRWGSYIVIESAGVCCEGAGCAIRAVRAAASIGVAVAVVIELVVVVVVVVDAICGGHDAVAQEMKTSTTLVPLAGAIAAGAGAGGGAVGAYEVLSEKNAVWWWWW